MTTEEWALYVRSWFPELIVPELRSATFAECASHHEAIKGSSQDTPERRSSKR